jgi:3',5'-nucleoside bisphosphate phosphatase
VFYAAHDEQQTRVLHAAARAHGLLATGSADFHGPAHERFSRFGAFSLYGLEAELGPIGG